MLRAGDDFAGVALALAVFGIYGVMSYSVGQRVHEIGIRIALGAESAEVLRLVIAWGLKVVLAGTAVGLAIALALGRSIAGLRPTWKTKVASSRMFCQPAATARLQKSVSSP